MSTDVAGTAYASKMAPRICEGYDQMANRRYVISMGKLPPMAGGYYVSILILRCAWRVTVIVPVCRLYVPVAPPTGGVDVWHFLATQKKIPPDGNRL